jgi:putative peptide zinc metalloprotease protein
MIVSAAGMIVELLLAAIALFVWINVEPGIVSNVAYNVMIIGSVSTLIFNGNPLLRFDGYYILLDAIEIPNLGSRANKYLGYLAQRYLFAMKQVQSSAETVGEQVWFVIYGISSYLYRLFILMVIAIYVSGKFFVIGILLACWAILIQVVVPLFKLCLFVLTSPNVKWQRGRAVTVSIGIIISGLILTFIVPVPLGTKTEGVIMLPEQAYVRAGTDCFISVQLSADGSYVEEGEPLFECNDPFLHANAKKKEAKKRELMASLNAVVMKDRVKAEKIKEELKYVEAELNNAYEHRDKLVIRSPVKGVLNIPMESDIQDRFVKKGELIAYVINPSDIKVIAVVEQSDLALIQEGNFRIEVRLADQIMNPISAIIKRLVPAATNRLPSKILGSAAGGALAVDPGDKEGLHTLKKIYQFELELESVESVKAVGGRVYVRFDSGYEPVANRWYRSIRQLFLRQFNV